MAMTLQDVREAIALKLFRGRDAGQASLKEWHAALVEHIHSTPTHLTQPAQAVDVGAVADALENEYLAVANGEKKPGKLALEPLVRAVQTIRALAGEQAGWRDIATAPKDGTYILLSQRWLRDEPFIGSWERGKWEPDTRCYETNGDAIVVSNISGQGDIDLWAPLPTSPTPDKDQR